MIALIKEVLLELGRAAPAAPNRVEPLGRGLIHGTYLVRGAGGPIVLQQLNLDVFPDPELLAANASRVIECLDASEYPLEIARPLTDRKGSPLIRVGDQTWRAASYIEGAHAIERVDTVDRAASGAAAFGHFCAGLVLLDPGELSVVIPGFHDFDARLAQLEEAFRDDAAGRAGDVAAEVDVCRRLAGLGRALREAQAGLPSRVCHNDTKINNLLFDDEDRRPRAVVDLDTCMSGRWMHDFGDIVRTFCSPEEEDSTQLDRVVVREDVFRAVCEGFTRPLAAHLSPAERESLWLGACAIPLIVGMRFLADHLAGDRYFPVARRGQNLDRARNQFAIHRDLTARENSLRPFLP